MAKIKFDENKAWEEALGFITKSHYEPAYQKLDELILNTETPATYAYIKASLLYGQQKPEAALSAINQSIELNSDWSQSNKLKAEILYTHANTAEHFEEALAAINKAIVQYTRERQSAPSILENIDQLNSWVEDIVATRSDMTNLKTSIESSIKVNRVQARVEEVERNVLQERIKSIEALGLFTAVLAVVFANVQAAKELKGLDFLWLNLGLVLPISFLVILISPSVSDKNRGLIIISAVAFVSVILGWLANSVL